MGEPNTAYDFEPNRAHGTWCGRDWERILPWMGDGDVTVMAHPTDARWECDAPGCTRRAVVQVTSRDRTRTVDGLRVMADTPAELFVAGEDVGYQAARRRHPSHGRR